MPTARARAGAARRRALDSLIKGDTRDQWVTTVLPDLHFQDKQSGKFI